MEIECLMCTLLVRREKRDRLLPRVSPLQERRNGGREIIYLASFGMSGRGLVGGGYGDGGYD